jgi:glutamate-5-semialdehyde dehydrogenase
MIDLNDMGLKARSVSRLIALAPVDIRNAVLYDLADRLTRSAEKIIAANELDLAAAKAAGLAEHLIDRLLINESRLEGIAKDLHNVASLPDPLGERFDEQTLSNGLRVYKMRVPIGVLGIIYESRPNVTVDVAALAIKTGNVAILRGGSESINSNLALVEVIRQSLADNDLPPDAIQFIDDPDRRLVAQVLKMHEYIDLIIPRGGSSLHAYCRENSSIPVITGGIGICHLYVDRSADLEGAIQVIRNAKIQRPSVCNALDTVLLHSDIAKRILPLLVEVLTKEGVTLHLHDSAYSLLEPEGDGSEQAKKDPHDSGVVPAVVLAGPGDFDIEWLSLNLGVKVVAGIDEAIEHIHRHSTGHSDGILTGDEVNARKFIEEVDSAATYVNASTRFTDGGQLGLGAEVAISTQRLHARGPMGLRELTTYKWVIQGDYHIRQ